MFRHKVDANIKQEMIQIDTTNILFILGGAFDGIEEVIKRRLGEKLLVSQAMKLINMTNKHY